MALMLVVIGWRGALRSSAKDEQSDAAIRVKTLLQFSDLMLAWGLSYAFVLAIDVALKAALPDTVVVKILCFVVSLATFSGLLVALHYLQVWVLLANNTCRNVLKPADTCSKLS